ncbi:MAG: hypothetical protein ACREM1_00095 [Longimicrobiales bacterium]
MRETSDLGLYRHAGGLRWDSLAVPPNTPGVSHAAVDETTGTLFAILLFIGMRSGVWKIDP